MACEGGSVRFPCILLGSTRYPAWRINGIVYPRDYIPEEYDYSYMYLDIPTVDTTMDGNTFQCFIDGIGSDVGILSVVNTCKLNTNMYTLLFRLPLNEYIQHSVNNHH